MRARGGRSSRAERTKDGRARSISPIPVAPPLSPRVGILLLASALVTAPVAWLVFQLYTRLTLEDALITYRYGENLALGRGFVFNTGEHVLGTTSPLFALMLAACGRLIGTGLIPACSKVLMAVAALGAGAFAFAALRRMGVAHVWAALGTAFTLLSPDMLWAVTGGMETALVLLLMAWALWAGASGRWIQVGLASALLMLARADGAVWAFGMLALCAWQNPRATPRALLPMAVLLLPWVVFAFAYFGNPLPQSIAAKYAFARTDIGFTAYLRWYLAALGAPPTVGWGSAPLWILAGLITLGIRFALRNPARRPLLVLAAYVPLFFVIMWLGHSPRTFPWYLIPPAWCSLLLAATGLGALYEGLLQRRANGHVARSLANATAVAVLLTLAAGSAVRGVHLAQVHRDWQQNEDGLRRVVGVCIDHHTPQEASVAMEAIGYQGTYSHRRVIDLAGLVSPEVIEIRRRAGSNTAAFHAVLDRLQPDYLVLRSFEVDRNLLFQGGQAFETSAQADTFAARYHEVARFQAPVPALWGPMAFITIYRRRQ
jgi:hypothetical protein